MARHNLKRLEAKIKGLRTCLSELSSDSETAELLRIIRRPGWTTPAEFKLVLGLVQVMTVQAQSILKAKEVLLGGSRAIGVETEKVRQVRPRVTEWLGRIGDARVLAGGRHHERVGERYLIVEVPPGTDYSDARKALWNLVRDDPASWKNNRKVLSEPVNVMVEGFVFLDYSQSLQGRGSGAAPGSSFVVSRRHWMAWATSLPPGLRSRRRDPRTELTSSSPRQPLAAGSLHALPRSPSFPTSL